MSGEILFDPLIPWPWIAVIGAVAAVLIVYVVARRGRGGLLRALAMTALLLGLANPRVVLEERTPRSDLAVIVVDDSRSMAATDRDRQAEAARRRIVDGLQGESNLEVRVVRAGGDAAMDRTDLFGTVRRIAAEDVEGRLAGLVVITDGQVHDAPAAPRFPDLGAPAHILLAGRRDARDRRLAIDAAPAYGLVGSRVDIKFRVEDLMPSSDGAADAAAEASKKAPIPVTAFVDGEAVQVLRVRANAPATFSLTIPRAGASVVELAVPAEAGEISAANNRAAMIVNGVRDRLRVLLVSGQPHPGERTWRNLLKSDPGVDLIHFTILRPPDKHDVTPLRELALIVFPVQQLFEEKIDEFDLIIFDRYVLRGVLPAQYLQRVADFVADGGALLLSVGPEFAGPRSLARTPLRTILPGLPTGRTIETPFRPAVTDVGGRHPITRTLGAAAEDTRDDGAPAWGRWFRAIDTDTARGTEVLSGPEGEPILIVDRVGEGRVALLTSDHLWLWARGYDGGGPHAELLRRLAHWLMREPDLEEERLRAEIDNGRLLVERYSMQPGGGQVTITAPDGSLRQVALEDGADGVARGEIAAPAAGVYRVDDGDMRAMAVAGTIDPPELRDLRTTDTHLRPFAEATGGAVFWLEDGIPSVRRVSSGWDTAGGDWIGLPRGAAHTVTGVNEMPFLPGWALLLAGLGGLLGAWWREGR